MEDVAHKLLVLAAFSGNRGTRWQRGDRAVGTVPPRSKRHPIRIAVHMVLPDHCLCGRIGVRQAKLPARLHLV